MGVHFSLEMSVLFIQEVECEMTGLKIRKYGTEALKKKQKKNTFQQLVQEMLLKKKN